jgi:hypothetical protein
MRTAVTFNEFGLEGGNPSKITIHTLRANYTQKEPSEDPPPPKGRQSKLRAIRFGVVDAVRSRSEGAGLLYVADERIPEEGLSSADENHQSDPADNNQRAPHLMRRYLSGQMRLVAVGLGRMIKIRIWGEAAKRACA